MKPRVTTFADLCRASKSPKPKAAAKPRQKIKPARKAKPAGGRFAHLANVGGFGLAPRAADAGRPRQSSPAANTDAIVKRILRGYRAAAGQLRVR